MYAQNKTITGTVTDSTKPLIGVNVTVAVSKVGTITDMDGKYTCLFPPENHFVFSYIGYMAQEIVVGSQSTIDVVLLDDAQAFGRSGSSRLRNNEKVRFNRFRIFH